MKKLRTLAATMQALDEEYGVDYTALRLLSYMSEHWEQEAPVRITDLIDKHIASRVTTHHRVQGLVSAGYVTKVAVPSDTRVFHLLPGLQLPRLQKFIEGTGINHTSAQYELF